MTFFSEHAWILQGILLLLGAGLGVILARLIIVLRARDMQEKCGLLLRDLETNERLLAQREYDLTSCRTELMETREKRTVAEERLRIFETYQRKSEDLANALGESQRREAHLSTSLMQERRGFEEKIAIIQDTQRKMEDAFKALSYEALQNNNHQFLSLAQQSFEKLQASAKGDLNLKEKAIAEMVSPLRESLKGVDQKLHDLEKERLTAFQALKHQVNDMILSQKELKSETANLVRALRTPHVRGRWGEMQLKRVAEISGMSSYCDFVEQSHHVHESRAVRPDMIVNLPEGKRIIVDAKAPLHAYLESLEAKTDEERLSFLKKHASQVKSHITMLSSKAYWDQFPSDETPEFVVLFLPGETFFSAALEQESGLIELAAEKKVILSTPTTLIALLQAIAYGWRQERIAKNAREISALGKELYKRFCDLSKHLSKLGHDLTSSVNTYNRTIGTFESRILPSARRFNELGISGGSENIAFQSLDTTPRVLKNVMSDEREEAINHEQEMKTSNQSN